MIIWKLFTVKKQHLFDLTCYMCKTLIIKNVDVNINEDLENLVNNPEVLLYTVKPV